jgi:hypothetical protein
VFARRTTDSVSRSVPIGRWGICRYRGRNRLSWVAIDRTQIFAIWLIRNLASLAVRSSPWQGEQTKQQQTHSWAVYHIKNTPAKFLGIVHD